MPFVKAGPDQYLLVGRNGTLENRGSAVQVFLYPGAIFVLVPSTKQEATFEFTQETKDGIPLRFKGIILFRITDPSAAARQFDFSEPDGIQAVMKLLTHVVLGELRHAVSHMTMVECIEQRKTTLSEVAETALATTIRGGETGAGDWGITVEVAQLAQVFIVDQQLRQQLEAEIRNEIKLKSDQSNLLTAEEITVAKMASGARLEEQKLAADRETLRRAEEIKLAEMASGLRVEEQTLAADRDSIRRAEEMDLAKLARLRRRRDEEVADAQRALELDLERFHAGVAADKDRVDAETPVRLLQLAKEREILEQEIIVRQLRSTAHALEVEHDLLLARATQDMRREMLPIEQGPELVRAAAGVLHGTTLSLYGEGAGLMGQLAPIFELLGRAAAQAMPGLAQVPVGATGPAGETLVGDAPD